MRVDAMIAPSEGGGTLDAASAYGVRFAISISHAEKAVIDKARLVLIASGAAKRSDYEPLPAAQGDLLDFMTAAAEVFGQAH